MPCSYPPGIAKYREQQAKAAAQQTAATTTERKRTKAEGLVSTLGALDGALDWAAQGGKNWHENDRDRR